MAGSPPTLPVPRQPSPLSFSSMGDHLTYSARSSVFESEEQDPLAPSAPVFKQPSIRRRDIAIRPSPDSIIYRTTLKQLESQTVALKRLTKVVLSNLALVSGIYEQLDKAEDELLGSLGELSRWLGQGYGLAPGVWDEEAGVRVLKREKRKREKEDLEVMVQHGVENVKVELKRRGLAGGGASAKFEKMQQSYYHQTGIYLAPGHLPPSQSTHHLNGSASSSSSSASHTADKAQLAKTAQIDLLSYKHHSALLYATPPSSPLCLDLLVSLHSWAGTLIPEPPTAGRRRSSDSIDPHQMPEGLDTPIRILSRPDRPPSSLKATLADSLTQMAVLRSELLRVWAMRNEQQLLLEGEASKRQSEADGIWSVTDTSPALVQSGWTGPVSSAGVENKRLPKKMHKIHRSVGGRLRDLLSSSSSSMSLASTEPPSTSRNAPRQRTESVPEEEEEEVIDIPASTPIQGGSPARPDLTSRHSVQLERGGTYVSPVMASEEVFSSPDLGGRVEIFARVGGFNGTGDEDEARGQAGRKNEGVLWGPGVWEGLGRPNPKSKWEMAWVVLDHSKIYEYGDIDTNQFECQATIDLRFASVREGRDTDRRFVFEVISAKEGRRLYQATSEIDMTMWLYAIANAIESCINGTSSVRTFDTSKLRTSSGALDDHALPIRHTRHSKPLGLGLPLPSIPSTPGNRRSMPPLGRSATDKDKDKRTRKPSFKNVLKQSGEKWTNVINGVTNRSSTSFDLPRPLPSQGRTTPPPALAAAPPVVVEHASPSAKSWEGYDSSHDTVIAQRVHEMAGLGLGDSPHRERERRRVQSEGVGKQLAVDDSGSEMARSRSAETGPAKRMGGWTMQLLREMADERTNSKCADCRKSTRASQWATLNLRGRPMVLFLCIRCVGLHRGLGTHISKPRSVALDVWSPDSIALAAEWGNERANEIWERLKPSNAVPTDDNISGYINAKYVEGRWLSPEDREGFTWQVGEKGAAAVVAHAL